jgi:hypothetical protein
VDGHTITIGYTNGTAQGSFYDTIAVTGAGLAPGTPVSYTVDFRISGTLSSPSFELGGYLSAEGLAEVRLRDLTSADSVIFSWDAKKNATGLYSLTLATTVGSSLGLSGMIFADAYVSAYAIGGRSAEADFYHSAAYALRPSVAGLNTLGASGHEFLTPVPEPATGLLLAAGLLALGLVRRSRG